MTPGFKVTIGRLEGQWWILFRRIHWVWWPDTILCFFRVFPSPAFFVR